MDAGRMDGLLTKPRSSVRRTSATVFDAEMTSKHVSISSVGFDLQHDQ